MTLPSAASRANCDAGTDDPEQALLVDLYDLVGKFNDLLTHLGLSPLTQDPLTIGGGLADLGTALGVAFNTATKTAAYTAMAADRGSLLDFTTAGVTLALTAAATLGNNWFCFVKNSAASGNVTIDPNGAETIDGAATLVLNPGDDCLLICNGTLFRTIGRKPSFVGDAGSGGARGFVPAPAAGDAAAGKFIKADGTWAVPSGVGPASVAQSHLKTTTGAVSVTTGPALGDFALLLATLPGGEYGFWPQLKTSTATGYANARVSGSSLDSANAVNSTSYATRIMLGAYNGGGEGTAKTAYAQQRYVQASPPYDLGDGAIPLFVFALAGRDGAVLATYAAPEAPWHLNGPTDIRPELEVDGVAYRWTRGPKGIDLAALPPPERLRAIADDEADWRDRLAAIEALDRRPAITRLEQIQRHQERVRLRRALAERHAVPVDQALKQADMALIPQPFAMVPDGATVMLLDPVAELTHRLFEAHEVGESVAALLTAGDLRLDNEPLRRAGPPGVAVVAARWR